MGATLHQKLKPQRSNSHIKQCEMEIKMSNRKLLFVSFALAFVSANCLAAETATLPEIPIGTTMEYVSKVATVRCSKWETVEQDKDGFIVCKCDNNLMYRNKDNLNLVKITTEKGKDLVKYSPELSALNFPLEVGKNWSSNYSGFTADNNASWNSKLKCEVKAFEKVSVAAGSFDAFRIDCEDSWQAGSYSGVSHSSTWYAPQVKEVVKVAHKEDSRFNQELKSYLLK